MHTRMESGMARAEGNTWRPSGSESVILEDFVGLVDDGVTRGVILE